MYPTLFTTPGVRAFAGEIDAERQRQLTKFGEQHHPDVEPRDIPIVTHTYYASRADIWKRVNAERATPSTGGRCAACPGSASGPHTHTAWDGVLLEEVYEALAESDPAKLRAELVQVAAVCAAWIADIDSRKVAEQNPDVCSACEHERCETCHACPCSRGEDWTCGAEPCPATRVRHSGPNTKFCVLCLSGEHERVDQPVQEAQQSGGQP